MEALMLLETGMNRQPGLIAVHEIVVAVSMSHF